MEAGDQISQVRSTTGRQSWCYDLCHIEGLSEAETQAVAEGFITRT